MKLRIKYETTYLLKVIGLITLFAVLSGCHILPVRHGHGHSDSYNSNNGHRGNDSHHSERRRSHSRDY